MVFVILVIYQNTYIYMLESQVNDNRTLNYYT